MTWSKCISWIQIDRKSEILGSSLSLLYFTGAVVAEMRRMEILNSSLALGLIFLLPLLYHPCYSYPILVLSKRMSFILCSTTEIISKSDLVLLWKILNPFSSRGWSNKLPNLLTQFHDIAWLFLHHNILVSEGPILREAIGKPALTWCLF